MSERVLPWDVNFLLGLLHTKAVLQNIYAAPEISFVEYC